MTRKWDFVAIDTGGTFTDIVAIHDQEIQVFKLPSTPSDPSKAVLDAIQTIESSNEILHGTTVATNAVLERKGTKVVLITTKGFADIIEIGRQNREDIYAIYPTRPEPLVDRQMRFELNERVNARGEVEVEINPDDVDAIIQKIESTDAESIAISFLFSFLYSHHEKNVEERLRERYPVSASSKVLPEYREYERTSTVVMDAYVKPIISSYLFNIENRVHKNNYANIFAVMKSDMGLAKASSLVERPVDTLFSGLAGGIKAAEYTSELTGVQNIISLDIGGTSTDVAAVINGKGALQQAQKIDGLPVARPAVDVITIGAGGGSLVTYSSGLIRVGPESAGANPGPVAYDQGGNIPTTTDCDLVYGVLPENLAGGILQLRKDLAQTSLQKYATTIGLPVNDAIEGIRRIFHENIAGAIRGVSTQRGHDPRQFSLLCFGGAGPVHAAELAEIMNIKQVIIPPYPGTWSAMGLIGGDYRYQTSRGWIIPWQDVDENEISQVFKSLEMEALELARKDRHDSKAEMKINLNCSMRFIGQSYDIIIPYDGLDTTQQRFIEEHRYQYGFAADTEPVELVALRVDLIIPHESPLLPKIQSMPSPQPTDHREVIRLGQIPVYSKSDLGYDSNLVGPCIVEQNDTTSWVPPLWKVELDHFGFMYLTREYTE